MQGFSQSPPNGTLLTFAAAELARCRSGRAIDIGCGAARNAIHLARQGWHVLGTDLSQPMLEAARTRADAEPHSDRLQFALAPMESLPAPDGAFDLLVAHGIWNLARSTTRVPFGRRRGRARRRAWRCALRVHLLAAHLAACRGTGARRGLRLHAVLGPAAMLRHPRAIAGGTRQVGFVLDETIPMSEHNLPAAGAIHAVRAPVIFEAAFRYMGV